jgi:hypothetical protein
MVPNTRVPRDEALGNLSGPIGGCVVRDDELEVIDGLREQRLEGRVQEGLAVVDRKADRNLDSTNSGSAKRWSR